MKDFIKKIGFLGILIIFILFVFDLIYTNTYINSYPRTKTKYVLDLKDKKIDYVFLGSSRVENHVVTDLVEKMTSKEAINLGVSGAKLDDIYLLLKILIDNNVNFEKLFIQVDYNFNMETASKNVSSDALPYIRYSNTVRQHLQQNDKDFLLDYYVPFYRYAVNDYNIGIRELLLSSVGKKSRTDFSDGFVPKRIAFEGAGNFKLPEKIIKKNHILEKIMALCDSKNIDVVYFCSPFCSAVNKSNYLDSLQVKIPKLVDYSKLLDDEYFYNCGHLNEQGAIEFTKTLTQELIIENRKR